MTKMKDLLVVISKTSGAQRNVQPEIEAALHKYGLSYQIKQAKHPPHLTELLQKFSGSYTVVAVYGGDGTVIAAVKFLADSDKKLMIFPGGTGNFIAKHLGLDTNVGKTIRAYAKNTYQTHNFDIASLNDQKLVLDIHNGWWAKATIETPITLKKKVGAVAYALAAIKVLPRTQKHTYTFLVDGKIRTVKGLTMIVANQPIQNFFGFKLFVRPHRPGIIQIAVLRNLSIIRATIWILGRKWLGHNIGGFIRTYRGHEITVKNASDTTLIDDQDIKFKFPAKIVGAQATTKIILPQKNVPVSPLHRFQILSKLNIVLIKERFRNFISGHPRYSYSQLSPKIYLGGQYKPRAYKSFKQWGVTGIVNMRSTAPAQPPKGFEILHLATKDWRAPNLELLTKGVHFIDKKIADGGGVYIHCRQGEGRGPTMAAAYLISQGLTVDQAIDHIRKMRPVAHPNKSQVKQLRLWAKQNYKKSSV